MQTSSSIKTEKKISKINKIKIAIASDHAGFPLKEIIKKYLGELGYEYEDFGTTSEESVDYPDYAFKVAEAVSENKFDNRFDRGILICGTGIGMSIAANKVPGIRAALCYDAETARLSREHNDANVLALGSRTTNSELAKEIVRVWLTTDFAGAGPGGERHLRRINKIKEIEKQAKQEI